ncbi:MAG: tetratricopeptide repeat protein, partial [Waddliaceae bacterium]
ALKLAPLDFRAYDGLALIEQNQENFELAEKYYKQALAIDPSYVQAKSNYGTLLLEQKRFAEAEVLYKELQSIDDERLKESPWIKSNYESAKIGPNLEEIKALVDAGKTDLAIAKYEILLKKHPDKTYLYEGLAQLYVEEKEYEKALGVYQSALEIEPDNLDIQAGIGFLYLSTENNVRAKGIFNGILESDPKNVNALAGLGRVEELTENRDKAEYYYKKALDIDPKNIRALALYASLLQEKGSYDEAKSIYGRVLDLTPNAEWAERGFYEAEYSPMLDLAQELIDKGQVQEAKNIYLNLIDLHPENIRYYFLLGQLYTEQEQYESALGVYQSALEIEPDNVNIQLQLGFVYLNIENFLNAENIFAHVLEGNPKNADALTGLGRLQELHKNIERASYYYDEALEVDPVNIRTLSFYADLLLQNKAYEESEAMYARILEIIPNSKWAEDGFYNAKYGPMLDLAINLQKVGREDEAAKIYLELISLRPENTGYYSILGQLYRDMQKYDNAICILLKGLDIDPDALYLWNLIGMIQIDKQELSTAYCIFLYVLEKNPSNVDAWAGLGRLNMLSGKLCRAREYYMRAIHLAKERSEAITPKAFLAELKLFSGYQFQATAISHELMTENPDQEWLFNSFERSYRETRPYLEVTGGYYEENEWDDLLEEFIIRYQVYGTEVDAICPINDCYTFIFDASDEYYVLKEIDEREDLFSLNIVRIHAGMRVVLNDFYQIVTKLGFSNYSPTKLTTFRGETKTLFEPTFNLIYNTPNETALFGFDTETNLVARNFITNRSEIIGRYFVVGRYAREMNKDFTTGFEAMGSVYNDYVKNASYGGSAWLQVTPSTLHDYLSVKYLFGYGGFKDVIPDYFTYKYRFINEIEVSLQKTWKEYLYSSFRYLHGWEMRNTRFAQVIVTPPFIINQPFFIERREYNTMSLNLDYNNNKWRAAIEAFYYRDTTKYTIWSAALTLGGYF